MNIENMILLIIVVLISTKCDGHLHGSVKTRVSDQEKYGALSNTQMDGSLIKLGAFLDSNKKYDGTKKLNSFNRKKVTTKALRSGQTAELICEMNENENPFKVSWSFRSRKSRKPTHIGNFYFNGLNTRYLSRFHNISVEWKEYDGFSKLTIPDVRKDLEGSYYCTVKTIERNNSCISKEKFIIKVKERSKGPFSVTDGSFEKPIYYPNLTHIATIANDSKAHLRDPSTPIFDPKDSLWHFWASRIPVKEGSDGYPGRIYHYYSPSLNSTFSTSGIAIDVSPNPGNFDSYGTFTPSAFLDKSDGRWTIFYGGVANSSQNHTEDIGIAISTNGAFGPFIKSSLNPVITWNDFTWCSQSNVKRFGNSSTPARVDEAEPYILNGQRVILVKTVCQNFTALPMMFASSSNDQFKPPFKLISDVPIINATVTAKQKGFEQARIYPGPDGYLHLTGRDHGDSRNPHFINTNRKSTFTTSWSFVGYLEDFGMPPIQEPNIVSPINSVPGDDYKHGIPSFFVGFSGNPFHIDLYKNIWKKF